MADAPKKDYSSPYDTMFDQFFADGRYWDEDAKKVLARGSQAERTLSFASKSAYEMSDRNNGDFNRTNVYGAFRFTFDKAKKEAGVAAPYSLSEETLAKIVALLEAHDYTVVPAE